jgi:hypothetical protein
MKIFPLEQIDNKQISPEKIYDTLLSSNETHLYDIIHTDNYIYTNSGKEAIRKIIEYLQPSKDDEAYITTTTESTFVSTCVSATLFNYMKISRVLTDKTKIVYVIHTFGFPHPSIKKLRDYCDEKNIILIEDCAFAFDSYTDDNSRVGSFGDFAIYSLPKIIPIAHGGILTFNDKKLHPKNSLTNLEKKLTEWIPKLNSIKTNRQRNYNYLYGKILHPIYVKHNNCNPFMYGFINDEYETIYDHFTPKHQFGLTHVKKEIHIPTNGFIDLKEYEEIVRFLSK